MIKTLQKSLKKIYVQSVTLLKELSDSLFYHVLRNAKVYGKKLLWLVLVLVIIITFVYTFYFWIDSPAGNGNRSVQFALKNGWSSEKVADFLLEKKIIGSKFKLKAMLRLQNKAQAIKSGYYSLHNAMTKKEIISVITSGRSQEIHITVPEGFTNRQIGDLLFENKLAENRQEFLNAAANKELLKKYNIPSATSEGYLFPDTYFIPVYYTCNDIVEMMLKNFVRVTRNLNDFPSEPKEIHNLVILASIVEREAQRKEERALIAGVFANRLKKNIPLESCATVQYLFEKPKKRLYYSDLEIESPYNTYRRKGLPPTPISNPGKAALESALHPRETDFLFFVVKGDGFHKFSTNFKDHKKAKNNYILKD